MLLMEVQILVKLSLIRELHVYGQLIPTYHKDKDGAGEHGGKVQHAGFGSKLMRRAELIAMSHGMYKMAVIAGYNYIAPASLFYAFLGTGNQKRRIRMAADEAGKYSKANAVPQNVVW